MGDNLDPDADGDGWSDDMEVACGSNPINPGSFPSDNEPDGIPDVLDTDDDNDGVPDVIDAFPYNSGESSDFDGDGIGDNTDPDNDNDGLFNFEDTEPFNPLNEIQTTLDTLGNDIKDIQANVSGIKDDLNILNMSDLTNTINSLNATILSMWSDLGNDMSNLENDLALVDANLAIDISNLDTSLKNEIQGALTTITNDISTMDQTQMQYLTSILDNVTSGDVDALRTWLEAVLDILEQNLTETNKTLHEELANLDSDLSDYYSDILSDIGDVLTVLALHDINSGENHSDIKTILNDLLTGGIGTEGFDDLITMLTNLALNLSSVNQSIANDLFDLVDEIETFQDDFEEGLQNISLTLDDMSKLQDILDDLNELDTDLQAAQESIEDIPTEEKDDGGTDLSPVIGLLFVVIVLLAINMILSLMGVGKGKSEPETLPDEKLMDDEKDWAKREADKKPEEEEEEDSEEDTILGEDPDLPEHLYVIDDKKK
jgi:hypothetical protein